MSISATKIAKIALALHCIAGTLQAQDNYRERKSVSETDKNSNANRYEAYIEKYNEAAIREMIDYGIPASITLAQGLLESSAGGSTLATEANNHFGIKCGEDWEGETYYKVDDDLDKHGNLKRSCFRKYESAMESFADHSEFLAGQKKEQRYGFLFTKLGPTDYKNWARGLQSAGYATAKDYADNLIALIERYNLQQYDQVEYTASDEADDEEERGDFVDISDRILFVNDVPFVHARKNETIGSIADQLEASPDDLAVFNDYFYDVTEKLENGTIIFLDEKKDQWEGTETYHVVEGSESVFDISQQYGIKLASLMTRNGLRKGQEPEEKERIYIRRMSNKPGALKIRTETTREKPASERQVKTEPAKNDDELDFEITPEGNESETVTDRRPVNDEPDNDQTDETSRDGYHLVKKGETLYSISRKYKTTVEKLKRLNSLKSDTINSGEWIKVK